MRQRLGIIITIVLAVGVLILINSAAYVTEGEQHDSELFPNRSTYNAGATGTRALHDFLNEAGYQVMRWREPAEQLLGSSGQKVQTFVIIGRTRVSLNQEEAQSILLWVARGGRLVIVDRHPEESLLAHSGEWKVTTEFLDFPMAADATKPEQMTEGVAAVAPSQPTLLTRDIESVLPSRFFSAIRIFALTKDEKKKAQELSKKQEAESGEPFPAREEEGSPPPKSIAEQSVAGSPAPVVHLETPKGTLLVDFPHGRGRIILLSDPFIVANGGISLRDNLQLALNVLAAPAGLVAFDEFHQGHGTTHNAFVGYFAGTPVLAICGQIVLLILLVLWTRGRRFARPLPLPQVDRRSSLEFVASMAELQQRARAYDLAIENIYSRTRRVLARYAGVDYNSPRKVIAERIAARSALNAHQLETLMRQSEDAINGAGIGERQTIQLVKRLREVESALGLRLRSREVKQTGAGL
jgi:hypothetical protein